VKPKSFEPDLKSLPTLDVLSISPHPLSVDGVGTFRGLSAEQCRSYAVRAVSTAALLEQENAVPDCPPPKNQVPDPCRGSAVAFLKQVRELAARSERNKAAAEALERFFQLADVEGRAEQLHLGMAVLDKYRDLVRRTDPGAVPPGTPNLDELDLKRADSVRLLIAAEEAEAKLNLDLRRRIGLPAGTGERLWPLADFKIPSRPIDEAAEVATGLENRADLQILRLAYLQVSPGTLSSVKEILRGSGAVPMPGPIASMLVRPRPVRSAVENWLNPPPCPDPCLVQEVAIRKQQLFDLIAAKERGAADEIRSFVIGLRAQWSRVGLARWKLDKARKAYDDWAKNKIGGDFAAYPLLIQIHVARAEVIDEVIGWHAARAKLLEAQGLLAEQNK
jgi:hypothetical protein